MLALSHAPPQPKLRRRLNPSPCVAPAFSTIASLDALATTMGATTAAAMQKLAEPSAQPWLASPKAHPNATMKARLVFQTQRQLPANQKLPRVRQPVQPIFSTIVKKGALLTTTGVIRAAVMRTPGTACVL